MNKEAIVSTGPGYQWLREKGYPTTDMISPAGSTQCFDGGGQYGVEIPVVNSLRALEHSIKAIERAGIYVSRFNETLGSFLLSDQEIEDMLTLCRENRYGMVISMGPRPEYDTKGAFYRTQFGLEMGRRINNNDSIRVCVEEAIRLAELGCRGITVYDIGVMRILSEMRAEGVLPKDMIFKTSTHCMAANPFIAKIFSENGADSVTTAHDLGLPVLYEMRRQSPDLALDVPVDVYKSKGGFIRFYEVAEMVNYLSPVMLKMGASAQGHPYDSVSDKTAEERVLRVARGLEVLDRYLPNKERISLESRHYALPQ